ncbi:MAG: bacteriohemerythrin [Gammaproteobacteria bacterium]|nr:bacteriohemerythrin [Gammaproteobacteria bacterium]
MEKLVWSSELDTGINVIDEQHKRIVGYINELVELKDHPERDKVGDVIDELVDYTISHFAFEESVMEGAGYPFLSPHKKIHVLFVKKVSMIIERFKNGEDVVDDLLHLLQKWLINHIKNEDGDYIDTVQHHMAKSKKKMGGWLSRFFR